MKSILKLSDRFFLTILFIGIFNYSIKTSNAQIIDDSTSYKNSIKLDIVPFYFDFFDIRQQIRIGVEYEHVINKKSFASFYLDAGLYDKYIFIKYYNFFNEGQGMYSIKQNVTIKGFHLKPSYNYSVIFIGKKKHLGIFISSNLDFNYYEKEFDSYNSMLQIKTEDSYHQFKMGIGFGMGVKYLLSKHLFVELKTSINTKLFRIISKNNVNEIKSIDAQWINSNNQFWWVSEMKIGYAF